MRYYIKVALTQKNHAGNKAPDDICQICETHGLTEYWMPEFPARQSIWYERIWLIIHALPRWAAFLHKLKKGDTVVYQHPMYGVRPLNFFVDRAKRKGVRLVAIIHDLETLRGGSDGKYDSKSNRGYIADEIILKKFQSVICHTEQMRSYLLTRGFKEEQLITLEIFDYLAELPETVKQGNRGSVNVAGVLLPEKSGYVYQLIHKCQRMPIELYGICFEEDKVSYGENVTYHGAFHPDELPAKLEGGFGIVWDGPEMSCCAGNTGNYLRYNCPHKTALYLAAEIPVIIWKQAAMASFVTNYNVGIAVDSLENLEDILEGISEADYNILKQNAHKIGEQLRRGYYTEKALKQAQVL